MPEVVMPRLDPLMEEGKIVEWRKREGERVEKGEVIVIVEGEKTTFEVESQHSGTLTKILRREGETVKVGEPIAIVGEEAEKPEVKPEPGEEVRRVEVKASPIARRLAREYGIRLEEIKGTGPGGRITKDDVLRAARERGLLKVEERVEKVRKVPFAGIRKAIATRLSPGFHQALPVALMTEFDAENLIRHRERSGKPSITSYVVKAVALALKKHPEMNLTLEGDEIVYHGEVNVAVGVDTPKGLMAPVIRRADEKSLKELTEIIDGFQERGRRGEITVAEQEGHSFTVTNLGHLGVTHFTPIINPPDSAILAIGAIEPKPSVTSDGGLTVRRRGHLTLVFDHRLIDGAPAARFLQTVKTLLENPEALG